MSFSFTSSKPVAASGNVAAADEADSSQQRHAASAADARYHFDEDRLQALKTAAPWMKDPKHFTTVALSPSAVMKIIMHCQSGVQRGIAKGGNPIEVMGMLLGRPDPDTPHTLVVTDAFPLPIEGFETRVIADDETVVNHMIALGESLETSRKEKFMGWYHSHPFDLGDHSHCFLSQTDLSTQLQWQRAEDPHGNPFVAIVVDPLRSAHLQTPELKAFRAYPPEYNSPILHECPDGSTEPSEQTRLEHWGSCWNRYYELNVEYFLSSHSRRVLEQLTADYLWMRHLQAGPDNTSKLVAASKQFVTAANTAATTSVLATSAATSTGSAAAAAAGTPAMPRGSMGGLASGTTVGGPSGAPTSPVPSAMTASSLTSTFHNARSREWNKAIEQLTDVADEELCEHTLQYTKQQIFG